MLGACRYVGVLSHSTIGYDDLCNSKYRIRMTSHTHGGLELLPLLYW